MTKGIPRDVWIKPDPMSKPNLNKSFTPSFIISTVDFRKKKIMGKQNEN